MTTDHDAAELKTCPFCGSDSSLWQSGRSVDEWRVHCHGCEVLIGPYATREKAAAEWNKRSRISALLDHDAAVAGVMAPCPFCGNPGDRDPRHTLSFPRADRCDLVVRCGACGADGPWVRYREGNAAFPLEKAEALALKLWNKSAVRALLPAAPVQDAGLVETLSSALERITTSYRLLLAQKPARDVAETLAEADRALATHEAATNPAAVIHNAGSGQPVSHEAATTTKEGAQAVSRDGGAS